MRWSRFVRSTFEPKDETVAVQLGGEPSDLAAVPALSNLVTDERGKELVDAARLMGRQPILRGARRHAGRNRCGVTQRVR
jgi:hypothetical protein